jgi:amino acid transporter
MLSQEVQTAVMTLVSPVVHLIRSVDIFIQYATAMFKVLFAYSGWQNVNYVLNDVKNPVRTLKIAGPLGLGITSVLYILANISYFAYVNLAYI